ncbi:MAG: GDP-mannose 4,6-dehydratase, partial [Thermoplasmata archaeon]
MALLPEDIINQIIVHYGDITDGNFLSNLLGKEKSEEIYRLDAQSFVGYSFQNALSTYDANIGGTLNVCNAIKDYSPDT